MGENDDNVTGCTGFVETELVVVPLGPPCVCEPTLPVDIVIQFLLEQICDDTIGSLTGSSQLEIFVYCCGGLWWGGSKKGGQQEIIGVKVKAGKKIE